MNKGKHQYVNKKPPETHNAEGGFGLVIKAFFLYGNVYKYNTHQSKQYAWCCMEARRIIKGIYCKAKYECQYEEQDVGCLEWQQQNEQDIQIGCGQVIEREVFEQKHLHKYQNDKPDQVNDNSSTHPFSAAPPDPPVL